MVRPRLAAVAAWGALAVLPVGQLAAVTIAAPASATPAGAATPATIVRPASTGPSVAEPSAAPSTSVAHAEAAEGSTCVANVTQLTNSSFEEPLIGSAFSIMDEGSVPGWSTTASDHKIELWQSGFSSVPAASGNQLAELNANQPSTLYQTVITTPGSTMTWSLAHRGRSGVDTMAVLAGPPGGPFTQLAELSDGAGAWGVHVGSYTVPANQSVTVFGFQAVSAAGGLSEGNLLDDITFGSEPCLTATKAVAVGQRSPGLPDGTLRYTVTVANEGGDTASSVVLTDVIPDGTAYLPGSLEQLSGPDAGPMTDANDSDGGTFNAATNSVIIRPGSDGAGGLGVLRPGEQVTVGFTVSVDPTAIGTTITNRASGTYSDGLSFAGSFTSNEVSTLVPNADDIAATVAVEPSAVPGGGHTTLRLGATNNGPVPDSDVTVSTHLPTGLSPDSLPSSCTSDGAALTCDLGSIAIGGAAQVDIPITVTAPPGVTDTVTVLANGMLTDRQPTNNLARTTLVVDPVPAVDMAVSAHTDIDPVLAGNDAQFTIGVTNLSEVDVPDATLTVAATGSVTDLHADGCVTAGSAVQCALGPVAAGATMHITFVGAVPSTAAPGSTIGVNAAIAAAQDTSEENNVASAQATVTTSADLSLIKAVQSTLRATGQADFDLSVHNDGPSTAQGVHITDTLPAGQVPTQLPPECAAAGSAIECNLTDLAVGETATLNYRVQLDATLDQLNTATVAASTPDPDTSNNTDRVQLNVLAPTDLAVSVTPSNGTVTVGSPVSAVVTVTNNGPWPDAAVRVGFRAPDGVAVTALTPSTGSAANGIWTIGSLAVGHSATLVIHGQATTMGTFGYPTAVVGERPETIKANNLTQPTLTVLAAPVPADGGGSGDGDSSGYGPPAGSRGALAASGTDDVAQLAPWAAWLLATGTAAIGARKLTGRRRARR